jgi:hypothetical protein
MSGRLPARRPAATRAEPHGRFDQRSRSVTETVGSLAEVDVIGEVPGVDVLFALRSGLIRRGWGRPRRQRRSRSGAKLVIASK